MMTHQATGYGSLYVVATPIGNLDDISIRALNTLKEVDFIIAEDTRHSSSLLNHFGIKKRLTSFHAFNEERKTNDIITQLKKGQSAALISDAGTPLISDPGYPLIKTAREEDIKIIPIPGPSALIAALSVAGVPCTEFSFIGFLPAKTSARKEKLKELTLVAHTIVFYESTHRVIDCIKDVISVFGKDQDLLLAKELTKTFETFVNNSCGMVLEWLEADSNHKKGEFVIIIPPRYVKKETESEELIKALLSELSLKKAVKIATEITGLNKNQLYQQALEIQKKT